METAQQKRVFISFDFDNDARLKDALVGQARYIPIHHFLLLTGLSRKSRKSGNGKRRPRPESIAPKLSSLFAGPERTQQTAWHPNLAMAQELRKPYFLLKGHPDKQCTKPSTARQSDNIYTWSWDNLEKLIAGQR